MVKLGIAFAFSSSGSMLASLAEFLVFRGIFQMPDYCKTNFVM
jgi:hypothetical protein